MRAAARQTIASYVEHQETEITEEHMQELWGMGYPEEAAWPATQTTWAEIKNELEEAHCGGNDNDHTDGAGAMDPVNDGRVTAEIEEKFQRAKRERQEEAERERRWTFGGGSS